MKNPTFLWMLLATITGLATLSVLCSITYSPLLIATIPLLMAGYKLKKYMDKIGV